MPELTQDARDQPGELLPFVLAPNRAGSTDGGFQIATRAVPQCYLLILPKHSICRFGCQACCRMKLRWQAPRPPFSFLQK